MNLVEKSLACSMCDKGVCSNDRDLLKNTEGVDDIVLREQFYKSTEEIESCLWRNGLLNTWILKELLIRLET